MKKQNENQNQNQNEATQATQETQELGTTVAAQEASDSDKEKKQRKIIIILAILLALSAAGLAARYLYLHHLADTPVTIEIPDNLVGEKEDVTSDNVTNGSRTNGGAGFVVSANASGDSDSNADQNGNTDENDNTGSNKSDQDDSNNPSNPGDNTDDPNNPDNPSDNTGGNTGTGGSSGRTGTRITLFEGNNYTKDPFRVSNMFPGDGYKDEEAKFYCIRIYHSGATTLYFKTTVTNTTTVEGEDGKVTKPLAENLYLKVVNLGTSITNPNGAQAGTAGTTHAVQNVICDNTFSNVDGTEYSIAIPASASGVTDVYFQINGYLSTTTGNECQEKHLAADFEWYVKDAGGGGGGGTVTPTDPDNPDEPDNPDNPDNPDEPDNPDKPDKPDKPTKPTDQDKPNQDGNLTKPPKTGDAANLTLWSVMGASALLLLIITVKTKRKEDAEDESEC